jgi:hypothetical protein
MTLTTLKVEQTAFEKIAPDTLKLPYTDDFSYEEYGDGYLKSRGNAPRYTTDQGGAFEVVSIDSCNVLMQQITPSIRPTDWGATSAPTTNLGDDTWSNYMVSVDVHFADEPEKDRETNYLGVGARYNLADVNESGYWVKLYSDGTVELKKDSTTLQTSSVENLDTSVWHNISITVTNNIIKATVDDRNVLSLDGTI